MMMLKVNKKIFFFPVKGQKFIHSTSVNYSNVISQEELNRIISGENTTKLDLIKYEKKTGIDDLEDLGLSKYSDLFPWEYDKNNKLIHRDESVDILEAIKVAGDFLEKRYLVKNSSENEMILNNLLMEMFNEEKKLTIGEIYEGVSKYYNENKEEFKTRVVETINTNTSSSTSLVSNESSEPFQYFGRWGERSVNQAFDQFINSNWSVAFNNTNVTINTVPVVLDLISYSVMLKGYIKYVHKRPYPKEISSAQRSAEMLLRNRQLAGFSLFGAPITLILIKHLGLSFKDKVSISTNTNISVANSGLFLLLSNLNKKIPDWVKIAFKLLFFIIIVLKLFGYNIIDITQSMTLIRNIYILLCTTAILYELLSLFLLHKFSVKNLNIPEILPNFIINWLDLFKVLSSNKESFDSVKKSSYIHIGTYTVIIILLIILI